MTALFLRHLLASATALGSTAFLAATPLWAQETVSREVVQSLPSRTSADLNRALQKLARNPRSVEALVEAGEASLEIGDLDAAIGFYGRAEEVAPNDWRVKLGKARVYMQAGNPVDALPFFAAAQAAGAPARDVLPDQALAFDMVGDHAAAQAAYQRAISLDLGNDEAKRRMAISYAISGDREGFEGTLRPLIARGDKAASRARAFGLAILGRQREAVAVVAEVMPGDLANRINPYLGYMPRLTRAQQAAAANLGIFPRAADIGRDDPRIAAMTGAAPAPTGNAGDRLAPTGAPLGAVKVARVEPEPKPKREPRRIKPRESSRRQVQRAAQPAPEPVAKPPVQVARLEQPRPAPQPAPFPAPSPQRQDAQEAAFDLARTAQAQQVTPTPTPAPTPAVATVQPLPPPSVADAFSDLGTATLPAATRSGDAVNIAAIEVPREKPPEPEPKKPAAPSRIWVQLATGKDLDALKFDWRRFAKKAPDLLGDFKPHTVPWGEANRLLAGPVASRDAARDLINALKEQGIETFRFTSPEGTEISELK